MGNHGFERDRSKENVQDVKTSRRHASIELVGRSATPAPLRS
jgi:hypothetical protein